MYIAYSHDGKRILAGIKILDAETGLELAVREDPELAKEYPDTNRRRRHYYSGCREYTHCCPV